MKKFQIVIIFITLATLANGGFLALTYSRYSKTKKVSAAGSQTIQKVVERKIEITNPKKKITTNTEQGKHLGEGDYKLEELAQSKIKDGAPAELVIATHEATGGHFVLALLKDAKLPQDKINSGWTINTIASDPFWAPGACSSKPTFLLEGKYIFIDDGKTDPADKYNSYVVFNMLTSKYDYFGGANFTSAQGDKESILRAVNENDKLVFYIDPADKDGDIRDNGSFIHTRGKDRGYIIRREVDPATMHYTDYSLPFTAPALNNYIVSTGYDDTLINIFENYNTPTFYAGKLINNTIALTERSRNEPYVSPEQIDNKLAQKLDPSLIKALPQLNSKQQVPTGLQPPVATTKFNVRATGSHLNQQFLIVTQQNGPDASLEYKNYSYETPAIYNSDDNSIAALTDNLLLHSQLYVPLGVF